MFAAASIEQLAEFYRGQGGELENGVWSVLVSDSAEKSAEFARRYFSIFNEIVHGGWHLAVFAKWGDGGWRPNAQLHSRISHIPTLLTQQGVGDSNFGILFFNPTVDTNNFTIDGGSAIVYIPLDYRNIGNENIYRAGFEFVHRCILETYTDMGLDPYAPIPRDQYDDFLTMLNKRKFKNKIKSHLSIFSRELGKAGLGALF